MFLLIDDFLIEEELQQLRAMTARAQFTDGRDLCCSYDTQTRPREVARGGAAI